MRRRSKTDVDHAAIRDGLRDFGLHVLDNAGAGAGLPDLWVRWDRWPADFWMGLEVKRASKKGHADEFTPAQLELRAKGILFPVVRCLADACEAVGLPVSLVNERPGRRR